MNAPPFPTNPSVGQCFGNWVWSGSRWVCTNTNGVRIVTQVFRASSPYMPSPGLITAVVTCIGGGGGAGAAPADVDSARAGSGGGSGGYSRISLAAGLVLGGVNVTVGSGGAAGSSDNAFAGQPGSVTSFGALCVANGGGGGYSIGQGGLGGAPGVGDLAFPGASGASGSSQLVSVAIDFLAGGLGAALLGGNVAGTPVNAGEDSTGPNGMASTGAGGTGGAANATAAPIQGGAGGSGICWVDEYCWADTVDDGCGCGPTGGGRVAIPAGPQGRGGWGYEGFDD